MDFDRIYQDFMRLSEIGMNEDGSVTRLLFDENYRKCAMETERYMQEAGLETRLDPCLNLHGVYQCGKPDAKTVYLGSHLDTVKQGGRYDGMIGVVGAVEAFRALKEQEKELNINIHIIGTNGEEGNILGGTLGSRAMAGLIDPDVPGYLEKAAAFGLTREDFESAKLPMDDGICYLELHIEQGNFLEKSGEDLGIVTGIVGLQRYAFTVHGESNHAGTTMMEYRKDALVGASKLITGFDRMAREYGNQMVATVGAISVSPGAITVIPERADFVLEIRNLSEERMDRFAREASRMAAELPDVSVEMVPQVRKAPVQCSEALQSRMEEICEKKQFSYCRMPSGATHDGNSMAMRMPIGMIFMPSKEGLSHCKGEFTDWEYVKKGITVLAEMLKELNGDETKGD